MFITLYCRAYTDIHPSIHPSIDFPRVALITKGAILCVGINLATCQAVLRWWPKDARKRPNMSKSDPKWLPRDAQNVPNGDQSGPKMESNWSRVLPNRTREHKFRFFWDSRSIWGAIWGQFLCRAPWQIHPKKQPKIKDEQISKIMPKGPRNDAKKHPKSDTKIM